MFLALDLVERPYRRLEFEREVRQHVGREKALDQRKGAGATEGLLEVTGPEVLDEKYGDCQV